MASHAVRPLPRNLGVVALSLEQCQCVQVPVIRMGGFRQLFRRILAAIENILIPFSHSPSYYVQIWSS
jgi:hypothetical protein